MLKSLALLIASFLGQAETDRPAAPDEPQAAERLRVAKAVVADYEAMFAGGGEAAPVERIERPLMTYGDPVRSNDNGTLWAWGKTGRPKFFLELYQNGNNRTQWIHAITLTSAELVNVLAPGNHRWSPASHVVKPITVEGDVGGSERMRLRQMKEIAEKFKAHEFWDPKNTRYELRLLIQPVHRYSDPAAGILDGSVFVIAHGTNPEILVLVEATGETPEKAHWNLHAARLGSAEMHLSLEDREIWRVERIPNVVGQPSDPYFLYFHDAVATPSSAN
jgi:hypothetical protein